MRQLNGNEKSSYLQAIVFIALSDDTVSEDERSVLKDIAINIGIDEKKAGELILEVENGKTVESILNGIKSRDVKLLLIYELITICYADGEYSNSEKETMKNICQLLNVEIAKLVEIEDIITEYIEFQKKVNKVLEVESHE